MPTYTFTLTSAQKSVISFAPKDSAGIAVPLDTGTNIPNIVSDTPTVARVAVFGGTWTVYGVSAGTATLTVTGTSAGGIALTETVLVTVTPDPATTFGLTFQAPVHQ